MDTHTYVRYAERSRLTLFTPNSGPYSNTNWTGFSNYEHFTTDGWLRPVVNPVSIGASMSGGGSPEAQAFVVMMHSAWRDWRWEGEKGKNVSYRMGEVRTLLPFSVLQTNIFPRLRRREIFLEDLPQHLLYE